MGVLIVSGYRQVSAIHPPDPSNSIFIRYTLPLDKQRMSRHREWDLKCKVYVGNLGSNTARGDLESSFGKYGALKNVWVARNPPGFAFVEFEDPRDAEDAVRAMDGTRICGSRVRVEMSSGRSRRERPGDRPMRGQRGGAEGFRGRYSLRTTNRSNLLRHFTT